MPYQLIYILSKKRENYTINFSTLCNFFCWNLKLHSIYKVKTLNKPYELLYLPTVAWWMPLFLLWRHFYYVIYMMIVYAFLYTNTDRSNKKKRNENHEKPNFTIWPKKFILFLYIVRWKTRTFLSIFRLNSKKQKNIRKKINRFFFKNSYTSFKCYMCTIIYWSRTLLVSLPTHHRSSFYFTWKCSRQRMIQ